MKRIPMAVKVSILFYLVIFTLQATQFFIAPSFYSASMNRSEVPTFIKLTFLKYFSLNILLYLLWGTAVGLINHWLVREKIREVPKGRARLLLLSLNLAQFLLLLLFVTYTYPSILALIPKIKEVPLIFSYSFLVLTASFFFLFFLWNLRIRDLKWSGIALLAFLLPTALTAPLTSSARIDLPQVERSQPLDQTNVFLLGFDALDGDSANGVLQRLAPSFGGKIYTNAFTPIPATNPAWNSILSGQYPKSHGVRIFFDSPLDPKNPDQFLQNILADKLGYLSYFAADLPETSYFNQKKGFQETLTDKIGWEAHLFGAMLNHFILPAIWLNNPLTETITGKTVNSPSLFNHDLARFFNRSFEKFNNLPNRPKLMALHTCHLHTPIQLSREELSQVPNYLKLAPVDFTYWRWVKPGDRMAQTPDNWVNPYRLRRPKTLQVLESLMAQLKAKGYLEKNLVVVLSDHGERFVKDYEIYGGIHGFDLKTRDQTNVPLAIFHPKIQTMEIIQNPVSLIDVAPTVLSLLGLNPKDYEFDGIALLDPEGANTRLSQRPILAESMGFVEEGEGNHVFPQISVEFLESNLHYFADGSVTVGPKYYDAILKNKKTADLAKQPKMVRHFDESTSFPTHGASL